MTVQPLGCLGIILSQRCFGVVTSPFDAHFSERAPSTMSALRRSLRAGFAAAKRVTAANAVGAAGPARAILAGSLRTQVRSDCFSETQSCSRRSRSIGRHARVPGPSIGETARTAAGFSIEGRSEKKFGFVERYRGVATQAPVRPLPAGIAAAPRSRSGRGRRRQLSLASACAARFSHRFFPALTRAQTQKHRPCPP